MGFPKDVANRAFIECGRYCCICHEKKGSKMELHHIKPKEKGGDDTFDNCIPLCFDCHADVGAYDSKHPKGHKYSEAELKGHRDKWYSIMLYSGGLSNSGYLRLDQDLFQKIRIILPTEMMIKLQTRNFEEYISICQELENFAQECTKPEHEFMDIELETLKKNIASDIRTFMLGLSVNCCRILGVPEAVNQNDLSKWIEATCDSANEIWWKYDEIIRLGRRKLGVQ